MAGAAEDWQAPKFRQSVIAKLNEVIATNDPTKNGTVIEGHIFRKSKSKEEYVQYVTKVLNHWREARNKQQQQQQQQQQQNSEMVGNPQMNNQVGVPPLGVPSTVVNPVQDPINALQNLAVQGNQTSRNQQMMQQQQMQQQQLGMNVPNVSTGNASNLLQTLTQQRPQMQQNLQGIRGPGVPPGIIGSGPAGGNQIVSGGGSQLGPGGGNQMGPVGGNQMGPVGGNQMGPGGGNQMGQPLPGQQIGPGPQLAGTGQQIGSAQQMGPGQQMTTGQQMAVVQQGQQIVPNQMSSGPQLVSGQQLAQISAGQPLGSGQQINGPGGNFNPSMNLNMGGPNGATQMPNIQQQGNQMQGGPSPGQMQMQSNVGMNVVNSGAAANQIPINQMSSQINQLMQQRMAGMGNIPPNQQQIINQQQMANPINQQQQPNQMNPALLNTQAMGPNGMPVAMNPQNQGQLNQMLNIQQMQKNQSMMVNNPAIFPGNRNVVGQQQFLRQSPSPQVPVGMNSSPQGPAMNASPAGMNLQGSGPGSQQTQMIPSPALVPSPNPQMPNMMSSNQRNLRQSPNAPLNTPGQVGGSPFNPQEDQMYREKYKQLTKYIEPLKRMVAKIGNDDVEKITKMNKLLEILTNPHQRIPLETLLKCEKALEKMDFKSCMYPFQTGHTFGSNNPLLEAVNLTLQSPVGNHTLQRTFRPCLEALFGTDIKCPDSPTALHKQRQDEDIPESFIPHVLQGEIARLDQKFKISLDSSSSQINCTIIKLICCIDDRRLPCVPPICVSIDEDYPMSSPTCSLVPQEYSATAFLYEVQNTLMGRIAKLPKTFSLSHLLDTWEMSIRHACSPKLHNETSSLDFAIAEILS